MFTNINSNIKKMPKIFGAQSSTKTIFYSDNNFSVAGEMQPASGQRKYNRD